MNNRKRAPFGEATAYIGNRDNRHASTPSSEVQKPRMILQQAPPSSMRFPRSNGRSQSRPPQLGEETPPRLGDLGNTIECDAVVLAVGATSAGKLAATSPAISSLEATEHFDKLRGITCVAVRLFLKPNPSITSNLNGGSHDKTSLPPDMAKSMSDSPISVCGAGIGGIDELKESGFCIRSRAHA